MQGSAHLFSTLQADLTQHMQRFEQAALRDSLSVPPGLLHPSALPAAPAVPCTPEDEQRADAQLAELRHKIKQVRCQCVLQPADSCLHPSDVNTQLRCTCDACSSSPHVHFQLPPPGPTMPCSLNAGRGLMRCQRGCNQEVLLASICWRHQWL